MNFCNCISGLLAAICRCGKDDEEAPKTKLKATVVLMRKNALDVNDYIATVLDNAHELLGRRISFQLVSATAGDPNNNHRGIVGEEAYLEKYVTHLPALAAGNSVYHLTFEWDESEGVPGAIVVKNRHGAEFYLKSVTIEDFPGEGRVHFVCNSWVYPVDKYTYDRVFFRNKTYLPRDTPEPLKPYRQEELFHLRGDDVTRKLEEWDRIYGYAYYNDLGEPDKGPNHIRPVLGGSAEYPYPRRGKTARPLSKDHKTESRVPILFSLSIYVPRDEKFGHLKLADFLAYSIKSLEDALRPTLESLFTHNEFKSFHEVLKLYEGGLPVPHSPLLENIRKNIPFEMIRELFRLEGSQNILKLPVPQVIQADKWAWRTDEEFAREMLAGVNPVMIRLLEEFPPASKLDREVYGNQNSTITEADIEKNLEGLTVQQALESKKLFILDYHDVLIPYLNRINSIGNHIYASRTLLLLRDDSTLKPLAIELSIPNPAGEHLGAVSKVYTPAETGVEKSVWQLAKAYASVNDSGYHQLISHWLLTHAAIEPFVMATNRHLSALHPINKLLLPHYRDTMNINALARQLLINAGGILETTVFPGKYAMEMSSVVYRNWNFAKAGLPAELISRGVAVEDEEKNIQLLIKDYPYAVDGLEVWNAIKTWVTSYCSVYYPNDVMIQGDVELQEWWTEIIEVGHGDHKNAPWWPRMQTFSELTESITTIIWLASAYHAAVNFGQYPYAGYLPNRPTVSRKPMPEPGTEEYEELAAEPDKVFLRTITSQFQTILGVSLIEILSTHSTDEIYLGQRDSQEWTADEVVLEKFKEFGGILGRIETDIVERNGDPRLKNRNGPVRVPYTLLIPTSVPGLTGKGIPNSVSI